MSVARPLLGAVFAFGLSGCCCGLFDLSKLREDDGEISSSTPGVDLGTAVYPKEKPPEKATPHAWRARELDPPVYRVGYALGAEEAASVDDALRDLAKQLHFKDDGNGNFRWVPPPGCRGDMHCVMEELSTRSLPDVEPLVERFRGRVRAANMSSLEAAELVVGFVQAIPYEEPKGTPFGILPPALVASQRRGDCDSKALLAHMILKQLGLDTVMLSSEAHRHSMLGVALPVQGTKIKHEGREYAFAEMTAKGAPIGWVGKDMLKPNDWVVVKVEVKGPASRPPTAAATGKAEEPPRKKKAK
jgi:hypothetical protein